MIRDVEVMLYFRKLVEDNNIKVFRGQSEGRSTLNKNEGVPDGTYYYILKYVDEENKTHDKAGYLYVSK